MKKLVWNALALSVALGSVLGSWRRPGLDARRGRRPL
jgi:hypothetical protein